MKLDYTYTSFINDGIEDGIEAYLKYKENIPFNRNNTFELYVIKALTIIYGEKSIILPYHIQNEEAFKCNLMIYDLREQDMESFLFLMGQYSNYLKHYKNGAKPTDLIEKIELILIEMMKYRSRKHEFTLEEISEFETIFNPIDGDLKQIKKMISKNSGLIINTWNSNKEGLSTTQINIMTERPNLLRPEVYKEYGLDIHELAKLPNYKIAEVNKNILNVKSVPTEKKEPKKYKPILITCGNGFVDKLMLLSIIMTEIMIGLVIASYLGG